MAARFPRLRNILPEKALEVIEEIWPNWEDRLFRLQISAQNWFRSCVDQFIKLVFLTIAVWIFCIIILNFSKALWDVYKATPLGEMFVGFTPATYAIVVNLFETDLFLLAFSLTKITLITLLVTGAVSQLLAVKRYLYDGHGFLVRGAWIFIGCCLAAKVTAQTFHLTYPLAQILCAGPTFFMLNSVIVFCGKVLPELNVFVWVQNIMELRAEVKKRNSLDIEDNS